MVNSKVNIRYIIFVFIIYIFIFSDLLSKYFSLIGYMDEIFALVAVPIFIYQLAINKYKIYKRKDNLAVFVFLFILCGCLGNLLYKYQLVKTAVLIDLFLNLKYWLAIYVGIRLFSQIDFAVYGRKIGVHIKIIVWIYIVLTILDGIFNIFPNTIRYGIKSLSLFYSVHTAFAAMCAFLLSLLMLVKQYVSHALLYIVVLLLLMASTLRSKAFGAAVLFILLYYLTQILGEKIRIRNVVLLGLMGILVGWSQIQYYFFSSIAAGSARSVLLKNCFVIARDHFPFGTGFATYASHYSGVAYSPIYKEYGISLIYGIQEDNYSFISDSFWPMIIGQNGYIGFVFFVAALIVLFRKIQKLKSVNKNIYLAALFSFAYLCISSIAESAFVSSLAVPLACVLGVAIGKGKI